jgi:hypothetical protein
MSSWSLKRADLLPLLCTLKSSTGVGSDMTLVYRLPYFVDGDATMGESVAIMYYILDGYGERLVLPAPWFDRAGRYSVTGHSPRQKRCVFSHVYGNASSQTVLLTCRQGQARAGEGRCRPKGQFFEARTDSSRVPAHCNCLVDEQTSNRARF